MSLHLHHPHLSPELRPLLGAIGLVLLTCAVAAWLTYSITAWMVQP